ncbi:hypothetical protein IV203_034559 [Nitzschia inconspicua]|uniref:Uncharacterized protein n=1 Tax=Nitzschia inconspicua TaxID=303405 RepID=A0A9K3LEN0_9STRA|nr:hypothetical protein IV203_034559 [Nitzschia inconspicua]
MRSRHVVFFLKTVMAMTALFAALMNMRYQYWSMGDNHPKRFDNQIEDGETHIAAFRGADAVVPTSSIMDTVDTGNNPLSRTRINSTMLSDGEFQHHDGVAIVTKIHGPHQWGLLQQSLCLLHFAYNNKVVYDIVVFTAEPIPQKMLESLRSLISPVNVTIALDNRGLKEEIKALSPSRYKAFLDDCRHHNQNTTNGAKYWDDQAIIQNLTWFSDCGNGRLAYNWQAEFRSRHIWHHPALEKYKWMMWMDTDGFCTKPWDRDPVAIAIENNLVIFFDNYHGGGSRKLPVAIANGFGVSLCQSRLTAQGQLESKLGTIEDATINEFCNNSRIEAIHGFFYITSLDFYRNQSVLAGIEALFGDCFLCRFPDDQLSVTIPAAILAPNRSWDMRRNEVRLEIYHNFRLDGRDEERTMGFKQLWKLKRLRQSMKEARDVCPVTERA